MNNLLIIFCSLLHIIYLFDKARTNKNQGAEHMKKKKWKEAVEAYDMSGEDTDVLGSYTGIYRSSTGDLAFGIYPPSDRSLSGKPREEPVQDADDL